VLFKGGDEVHSFVRLVIRCSTLSEGWCEAMFFKKGEVAHCFVRWGDVVQCFARGLMWCSVL
jgi:hypothetical protein